MEKLGSTLITGISELVTNDGGAYAAMTDAALVIADGRVAWTGPASRAPAADAVVDAGGRAVLPGFVDSHAHLVFAGERSAEFAARMAGRPYRAGGILVTVEATRAASDEALRANVRRLAAEMLGQGTTTFECKSGYGLTVPDEARGLALAAEVTPEVTYLGAHVVPPEFAADPAGYVDLVCGPMLDGLRAARPVDRRVLRGRGVRRRRGRRGARGGPGRGPGRPGAREPARSGSRRPGRGRGGRRLGRPLHLPDRRRRGRADLDAGRRHLAARRGVRHQAAVPRRAPACWTRGPRWRWPPTATRVPPSRAACRSASRSPSATCG